MIGRVCDLIRMREPIVLNRGLLSLSGATVPTDGDDGYQPSCYFQDTTNGILYVNEGSVTSCIFNAVTMGGLADVLTIGAFASLIAGSGIPLSSSQTSSIVAYGDDNGLSIASSVYNIRSRLLLTVDQDGASIRAFMGQLKLADGVDVSTGIYTAVQGYVELAGSHSAETGSTFTCFDASVEIAAGEVLTVDSGGEFAGIRVETTGTGTIVNNGTCAGVLIDKAAGAANWPYGVYVVGACAHQAFVAGVQDAGVETTTTYPFAVEIHNEANADIVAGATGSSAGIYNRYAIEAAQTSQTNHISVFAKLRVKADLADGNHVAVYGLVEQSAGSITGTGTTLTAAGHFSLDISPTNITTGHLNGITIDSSVANGGTMSATMAGIRLKKKVGAYRAWVTGITLEDGATTTGINIGTCTTAITIAACTTGITFTGAMTDGLMFSSATFAPNTGRTDRAIEIGGRGGDELTITFAGGASNEHFEPIQMNFDFRGTNPAALSTVNIWQGGITLDDAALANVRLKWSDLLTTVSQNVTDVYIHQGEIVLGGSITVSSEVAAIGLVVDQGSGTITCPLVSVITATLRSSGTNATNTYGYYLNVQSGVTAKAGIRLQGAGTMTTGIELAPVSAGAITNAFSFPAGGTAPVETGDYDVGGGTAVRISVLVGGSQYYILASTTPTGA